MKCRTNFPDQGKPFAFLLTNILIYHVVGLWLSLLKC